MHNAVEMCSFGHRSIYLLSSSYARVGVVPRYDKRSNEPQNAVLAVGALLASGSSGGLKNKFVTAHST